MISKVSKVFVVVIVVSLAFALSPVAEARDFAAIYRECGIGAMLAKDIPILAIIINIYTSSGTPAILSDVSSPESCSGGSAKAAAFIHDAYDSIEKDLARGNGEYLNALMALSGCNVDVYQPLSFALRNDLSVSVANQSYTTQTRFEKAENLYNLFYKQIDGQFFGSCSKSNS